MMKGRPAPVRLKLLSKEILKTSALYVSYIHVDKIGPMIMPASKKALYLPKSFPRTFEGTRSACKALVAGIEMLKPKDLKNINTVA